jgi:hypothetical protein
MRLFAFIVVCVLFVLGQHNKVGNRDVFLFVRLFWVSCRLQGVRPKRLKAQSKKASRFHLRKRLAF